MSNIIAKINDWKPSIISKVVKITVPIEYEPNRILPITMYTEIVRNQSCRKKRADESLLPHIVPRFF